MTSPAVSPKISGFFVAVSIVRQMFFLLPRMVSTIQSAAMQARPAVKPEVVCKKARSFRIDSDVLKLALIFMSKAMPSGVIARVYRRV